MKHFDVLVIGAGAAGMMSAVSAARKGVAVGVIEKKLKPGRKIMITGKGRCNFTNMKDWREFSTHIHPDSRFFKHSFFNFSNRDTLDFFNSLDVTSSVERGDRVFPDSAKASSIVDALKKEMDRLGVSQYYGEKVVSFSSDKKGICEVNTKSLKFSSDAVIMTTGGLSYPSTGSEGDGHFFAEQMGHMVVKCMPSLTALMPLNFNRNLVGIVLKNIELSLVVNRDVVQTERGEMEFTNNGIEGSLGYKISRKAVKAMVNGNKCSVVLNLKPALSHEQLFKRLSEDFLARKNDKLEFILRSYMPSNLVNVFASELSLLLTNSNNTKRSDADILTSAMQEWVFDLESFTSYERAVVTAGGVALEEVNPKTMKSKIVENLFFAGEILNLDGDTGGYNLQIAFSTGYKAGEEAAYFIIKSKNTES
jgi:predicted Rossmann fold flavoprotein